MTARFSVSHPWLDPAHRAALQERSVERDRGHGRAGTPGDLGAGITDLWDLKVAAYRADEYSEDVSKAMAWTSWAF